MASTRLASRRRSALALTVAIVVAAPLASAIDLAAPASGAQAATTQAESPDFATRAYGDPWDYSNSGDQNTDAARVRGLSIKNGVMNLRVGGGDYFTPIISQPGSLAVGRDGAAKPVSPSGYDHVSFKMNQPSSGVGAIWWWTCSTTLATCGGGQTFKLYKGTHVYNFNLTSKSTVGAKRPWNDHGKPIVRFRIAPTISGSKTSPILAKIDWLRIYKKTGSLAAYPAGTYDGVKVVSRPISVVDSPNTTEGKDISTAQGRKQWVFTSAAAARGVKVKNATVKGYGAAGMTATNSGSNRNDPEVLLPVSAFSGSTYRYFSFRLTYNGGYSLANSPGGGKMARLVWNAKGTTAPQESNDIVTYSGPNARTLSVDLAKGNPLDENSRSPRLGWKGRTITSLRFDPNEDPGANTWHLSSIHLRKAPAAKASTVIKFHDAAWIAGTTATIKVGKKAPGGSGYTTLAPDIPVTKGSNHRRFTLGSKATGAYYVQVTLRHPGGGTSTSYSTAPITMSR
ncbi:hypothetical protein [Frondihabitans sp. Leaf304]|uniref:hypothetical protein n=1 Tax=Frondihabitans sp. Leaf304 TaxID=1736329 RepID=UPI0006FF5F94|nr:hypothetical protein [Frondihabitans sp. Leaf304]KQQ26538.1 hypothetical protein ASF54_11005 [Frondihabitans sp. Leaf304]